jgi:hypothetical protein
VIAIVSYTARIEKCSELEWAKMVKCIDCKYLLQGYLLLRRCNGEVVEAENVTRPETTKMFHSKGLLNEDFECEKDHYSDGHPAIIRPDIFDERECSDFKKVKLPK